MYLINLLRYNHVGYGDKEEHYRQANGGVEESLLHATAALVD